MSIILINFEGIIDDTLRDEIESACGVIINSTRNVLPVPPEEENIENYIFTVIGNLLDPENDWTNPTFIFRLPDAHPVFTALFLTAFMHVAESPPAILDLHFNDEFPPDVDQKRTNVIPLHKIRQRARQFRYVRLD